MSLEPLDHPLLVLLLHREDLVRAPRPQVLRLLQAVDVVKPKKVETFQLQTLLLLVSLVVESETPGQVLVLALDTHESVELDTDWHIPKNKSEIEVTI